MQNPVHEPGPSVLPKSPIIYVLDLLRIYHTRHLYSVLGSGMHETAEPSSTKNLRVVCIFAAKRLLHNYVVCYDPELDA